MKLPFLATLRANQTILFLCVATALLMTGQGIAGPILPLYAKTLHVSTAEIGLVISAFGLARFLTNMPAAILSDKWGRRMLLVGGPFISAIGNALVVTSGDLPTLLVYRFISGIGSAAFITGAVIFISDITAAQNRGSVLSLYQGAFILGITMGPAVGGLVAEAYGLQAPFVAIAVVSAASGLWALLRIPETRWGVGHKGGRASPPLTRGASATETKTKRGIAAYGFLLTPSFLIISLVFMGTFFTRGGAQFTLQPLKAATDLGLSPGQIGLLFSIPSIIGFVAIFLVGYLSDRYGRKRVIVPGMLLSGIGLAMTAWDSVWPFAFGMALGGLAQALAGSPAVAYVADISPAGRQAVAQGMARSVGDFSLLIAPPLMGFAADTFGMGTTLFANAVALLVIAVVIHFFADDPYGRSLRKVKESRATQAD